MNVKPIHISLYLLIVCMCNIAYGQAFQSVFGSENTEWNVILFGVCDATFSSTVTSGTDTLINDKKYHILEYHDPPFSGFAKYIREDIQSGRIWIYRMETEKEYLIMDLSLNKGDSFTVYNVSGDSLKIEADSVFYENNRKHITFIDASISICVGEEKFQFIEGTGTNAGLFYTDDWEYNTIQSYLLCHYKNNEKVYGNALYFDTCYINEVRIDNIADPKEIYIYPNPCGMYLTIKRPNPNDSSMQILIYDSMGHKVKESTINGIETTIELNHIYSGIYYYVIHSENGNFKTGKILKK